MNQSTTERIGIFGGRFDPIHIGHLLLAQAALEELQLTRIVFLPSGGHAHYKEEDRNVASGPDRLEMARLAVETNPFFEACDYEVKQKQFCYTIDTLRRFRGRYPPGTEIFFLVGGDWKDKIPTWKDGDLLTREFNVALFSRPGFRHETHLCHDPQGERILYVDMPLIDISSSMIRERVKTGKSILYRVPEPVRLYIEEKGLYR